MFLKISEPIFDNKQFFILPSQTSMNVSCRTEVVNIDAIILMDHSNVHVEKVLFWMETIEHAPVSSRSIP